MAFTEGNPMPQRVRLQAHRAGQFFRHDEFNYPQSRVGKAARAGEKVAKGIAASTLIAHQLFSDAEVVVTTRAAGPAIGTIAPTALDVVLCAGMALHAKHTDSKSLNSTEENTLEEQKLPHERKLLARTLYNVGTRIPAIRHIDADIATITAGPQLGMATEIKHRRIRKARLGHIEGNKNTSRYLDLAVKHPALFLATNTIAISQAADRMEGGAVNTLYGALTLLAAKRAYEVITDSQKPTYAFRTFEWAKKKVKCGSRENEEAVNQNSVTPEEDSDASNQKIENLRQILQVDNIRPARLVPPPIPQAEESSFD